jgi:hypothetical protein
VGRQGGINEPRCGGNNKGARRTNGGSAGKDKRKKCRKDKRQKWKWKNKRQKCKRKKG